MQVQNAVDDVLSRTNLKQLLDAADNMDAMHPEAAPVLLQVENA